MQEEKDKNPTTQASSNPRWWTHDHTSAWSRIKEALKRDWEQTKADFSKNAGHDLNQKAGDTVKQMAGKEAIPEWQHIEPAMRFGAGASTQFKDKQFGDHESVLRKEWDDLKSGRDWESVKSHVRNAWDAARKKQ